MNQTTILIVENEGVVAVDLAHKLQRLGYEVVGTAATGEQAIAMADRFCPHIVLMDIRLDGPIDGIEAAEADRAGAKRPGRATPTLSAMWLRPRPSPASP